MSIVTTINSTQVTIQQQPNVNGGPSSSYYIYDPNVGSARFQVPAGNPYTFHTAGNGYPAGTSVGTILLGGGTAIFVVNETAGGGQPAPVTIEVQPTTCPNGSYVSSINSNGSISCTALSNVIGNLAVVYNTTSVATNGNLAATSMVATTSSEHDYLFGWTVSLTTAGTGCSGTTTVVVNAIFTDPNGGATTEPLGTVTLATNGNGNLGFVASGVDNILAASGTAVQYSASGYTAGASCSVNPTYQVTPSLIQAW